MADQDQVIITVRIPRALLDRLDDVVGVAASEPAYAQYPRVTRATVLRECLSQCVERLERRGRAKG